MQHVAVLLEHVDLLNTSNRLHSQFLQGTLELGVLTTSNSTLGLLDNLAAGRTLATGTGSSLQLSELLLINDHSRWGNKKDVSVGAQDFLHAGLAGSVTNKNQLR